MTDPRPHLTPARRIRLRRTKGWRLPPGAISCCRPSRLGNPFTVRHHGLAQAVALHRTWLTTKDASTLGYGPLETSWLNAERLAVLALLPALRGHDLACWCPEPAPYEPDICHAATLLELANAPLRCEAV